MDDPLAGAIRIGSGTPLPAGLPSMPAPVVPVSQGDPLAGALRIGAAPREVTPHGPENDLMMSIPEAQSLEDAWKAGWQGTGTGLQLRQEKPEFRIGESTPFWEARAAAVSGLLADFPLMFGAGIAGSMTPAGPIGGAIAAGAVPSFVRSAWMQKLAKGDIVDSRDFAERVGTVAWDTTKGGATMGIMHKAGTMLGVNQLVAAGIDKMLAGKIVSGAIERTAAGFENQMLATARATGAPVSDALKSTIKADALSAAYKDAGVTAAQAAIASQVMASPLNVVKNLGGQIVAGTVAGAALEGRLPEGHEFLDTSIALFGLHYTMAGSKKLMDIYAKSGRTPSEVRADIEQRPSILTDLFPASTELKKAEAEKFTTLEAKIKEGAPIEMPADASPVLRRALEIVSKPEKTAQDEHFLDTVRTGDYASMGKGTVREETLRAESEKKIQELELKAAEERAKTTELDAEQKAKLEVAQQKHDQTVSFLEGKYKDNPGELNVRLADLEKQFRTEKRQIAGEMTSWEIAKREAEGKKNFAGKEVIVNGLPAVVEKAKASQVTVRFADGTTQTVKRDLVSNRPVKQLDMTVGMTPKEVAEYQLLKSGDLGEIGKHYGIAVSDRVLGGDLPRSVANDPVYRTMRAELEASVKGREDLPKEWAEASARVYYAMFDSLARRLTLEGRPTTVEELFKQKNLRFTDKGPTGESLGQRGDETPLSEIPAGLILYHGTRGAMRQIGEDDILYMTTQKSEANFYANGLIPGTSRGQKGESKTLPFTVPDDEKVLDISRRVNEALMNDEDIDTIVKTAVDEARANGKHGFVSFEHPSGVSDGLMQVYIPLYPDLLLYGQPLFQENRGYYSPSEKTIGFLKGSDPTTAIHEGWHFFFDTYVDIAREPNAPLSITADVGKMFDYLGIKDMAEWDALANAKPGTPEHAKWVEAHETMARSGEAYVMTGDFPATGLRAIFGKFQSWLEAVYQTLDRLGVNLTPEIRRVFDRMVGEDSTGLKGEYADLALRDKGMEIMPMLKDEFKAEQVAMQPYPDFPPSKEGKPPIGKIHTWRVNSREDVEAAILRIQEVWNEPQKPKSWGEADYEAAKRLNELANDGDARDLPGMIEKLGGGEKPADERFRAMTFLLDEVAKDQVEKRETALSKWAQGFEVSAQEQIDYLRSIERTHMVFKEWTGQRAAIGRALNQMRQVGRMENTDFLSKVLHQSGKEKEEFLQKQLDDLLSDYKARFGENVSVKDIAMMDKKNRSMREQVKFNEAVLKASNLEKFIEVWKAWGLLSGPVTTVTNVVGTGGFMYMRPIIDMLSAGFGVMRRAEVGERQSFREGVIRLTSMTEGIIGGAKAAVESMKTETPTGKVEAFRGANEGTFGAFARLPFRLMSGGDVWTQFAYKRGELQVLATRQALAEGSVFGTREMGERVAQLMLRPTAEMTETMEKQSARMAFNDSEGGYNMAPAMSSMIRKAPVLSIIFPFVRTPLNVLDEVIRMSPLAPFSKSWLEAMAKPGIESDRAKAEFALGVGVFSAVIGYALSGNITGNGPPDPGKKKTWLATHQPYSVKIGNKWYEYSKIQPVGTLIGMAADMAEIWDHVGKDDQDKVPKMIAFAFANAVTNQTFLQGLASALNAMSDPDRYGPQWVHSFVASSVVPALLSQTAAMRDPYAREVYTTMDAIKNRVAGLRETLEPKIDWTGEKVEQPARLLGLLPVRYKETSEDVVKTEADRLGISVPTAPKKLHIGRGTGKLGDVKFEPEERTKYAEESGKMAYEMLAQIVSSDGWKSMPEKTPQELAVKRNVFHKVLASSHKYGAIMAMPIEKRQAMLEQITQKFTTAVE